MSERDPSLDEAPAEAPDLLTRVVDASLRHRFVVLLLTGLLVVGGVAALRELPLDAFPDTTPVQVTVNTVAPNLSPEEVERQITFPVEQVLSGLPGLLEVRSISKFGLSQVTLVFELAGHRDYSVTRTITGEALDVSVELEAAAAARPFRPRPPRRPEGGGSGPIGPVKGYKLDPY